MKDSHRVTVVSACAPELRAVEAACASITDGGCTLTFALVGIGLVDAALGMRLVLDSMEERPDCVVLVGTCGAYAGSTLRVGDVCVPSRVCVASGDAAESRAALLGAEVFDLDAGVSRALGGPGGLVATTLGITTDDALACSIERATGATVEHLEAWSVAKVCRGAGLTTAVVLGVANAVGARGREEWRTHRGEAERAAAVRVADWLSRGAPGLRG